MRDVVVGEAQHDRVGTGERRPGERGVQAEQSGCARQQHGSADVGDQADADLGHRDLRGVGHHPDAAVHPDPEAAAHHDAVHQHDVGLGERCDAGVEAILVEPEPPGFGAVGLHAVVDRHHVAAGAQSPFPGAGDDDGVHRVVSLPIGQGGIHGDDHGVGQGVDGLRAIKGQKPDPAVDAGQDLVGISAHRGLSVREKVGHPSFTRKIGRHINRDGR